MNLTFLGAAHEVTGSCILLEACNKNILIDCGMEQGRDIFVNQEIPVTAADIDYVLLTHAHIDHSGKLPLLYAQGFRGAIYSTEATADLCSIMLRDSAHIQEFEAQWRNRKAARSGKPPYVPLYTMDDAIGTIALFNQNTYNQRFDICEGISVRFNDAGHLLGSASIEVWVTENQITKKLVFSGDIGNINKPILRDPTYITKADYVITESTYGNRSHGETPDYVGELASILQRTFDRGGNVIIPSFAVGRTQEMLYFIRKIKAEGKVKGHNGFNVYVDSPLAVEATSVFKENVLECFDDETMELIKQGVNPISFDGLRTSSTSDESKAINFDETPKVIISASGMCEAGRIRHHLKHNLWRAESTVLFVGYQSEGTIGRLLLEGATEVKLFGERISVRAEICSLNGVSGHADNNGLICFATAFNPKPTKIFVVHGDEGAADDYTARLNSEFWLNAVAPYSGDSWDLIECRQIAFGDRERIKQENKSYERISSMFDRLLKAAERLISVAKKYKNGANKDIIKFADQINSLSDKWDK